VTMSKKLRVEVDVRTDEMSVIALTCRSFAHQWQLVPVSGARRTALLREGLAEYHMHCLRCGGTRIDLYTLPDFTKVGSKMKYADDYLMPTKHKGTGRLPIAAARRAMFVRDDPNLG